jgi:hypothetical protein
MRILVEFFHKLVVEIEGVSFGLVKGGLLLFLLINGGWHVLRIMNLVIYLYIVREHRSALEVLPLNSAHFYKIGVVLLLFYRVIILVAHDQSTKILRHGLHGAITLAVKSDPEVVCKNR